MIHEREISLDTETTGFKPSEGHRLVEIGCVEMVNRLRTGKVFHAYINPERDIPEGAFNIHGLSREFLSDKPLFADIADDFLSFIGDSKLIIHNADFDIRFLNAELLWQKKREIMSDQVFCTLKHARKKFPGSPANLDALCRRFEIDNTARTKHGALLDAELLADMYLELMGGSQVSLELGAKKISSNNDQSIKAKPRKKLQPRPHEPSQMELDLHDKFMQRIGSFS